MELMTLMPYWLTSTLAALPAVLWMIGGLGLPFALAALPRSAWREPPLVLLTALAFGPALLTGWMFVLGTVGGITGESLLTLPLILGGTAALALTGSGLAWRKRSFPIPPPSRFIPLAPDERWLVLLIVAALVLRWLVTAYWNFTAYDPLWVYGYEGRLYALRGFIPTTIGYYPQFVPLQYTFAQLAAAVFTGQVIDDHAARAVLPFLHLGSVLAAYALGKQVFTRRVGIFTTALWALYPHVAEWARIGDLEIPLTFAFTGAAAFFLKAWLAAADAPRERRLYALNAGLWLGIAMWTKPTAGAFILGVGLLSGLEVLRVWRNTGTLTKLTPAALRPRLEVVLITAAACIPLGAAWYLRNLAYGHEPITLPNPFWLTQALRSGAEFGWLVLALTVLLLFVRFTLPRRQQPDWRLIVPGIGLIAAGLLPTLILPYDPPGIPNRMDMPEWLALTGGSLLIGGALWRTAARYLPAAGRWNTIKIGWALALALPYFITWFISYSYHYRLSFPIVPLLILPTALLLAHWTNRLNAPVRQFTRQPVIYRLALLLLCLPGVFGAIYQYTGGWDYLWSNEFPTDFNRLEATNLALAWTVKNLQDDMAARGLDESTVIVAPGLQRLPFFFPLHDVRITVAPTELAQLADADYYIYTQEAAWYYPENRLPLLNQVTGSLARINVMEQFGGHLDRSFWSRLFRVAAPDRRFREPRQLIPPDTTVTVSDFAAFTGYRLLTDADGTPILQQVWHVRQPAAESYRLYVHLLDAANHPLATWEAAPAQGEFHSYDPTLWEAGEYVIDRQRLVLPDELPAGSYRLRIGFADPAAGDPLPLQVGDRVDDGYTLPDRLTVP